MNSVFFVRVVFNLKSMGIYLHRARALPDGGDSSQAALELPRSRRLSSFIGRAAENDLPVLILGEFGLGRTMVAFGIHQASRRRQKTFFKVNCATLGPESLEKDIPQILKAHPGGSLFLHEIDQLAAGLQASLAALIEGELDSSQPRERASHIRFLACSRQELGPLVAVGLFHETLHAQISWLSARVRPLRERPEDLDALIAFVLSKHELTHIQLGAEVRNALHRYPWPGNLAELERVLTRLACVAQNQVVEMPDLLEFAPELLKPTPCAFSPAYPSAGSGRVRHAFSPGQDLPALIEALAEHRCGTVGPLHPGLEKALQFMTEHLADNLSLHSLATKACLSPSHLSHLFRSNLGVSYKPLLIQTRIARARRILAEAPHESVSEVAGAVGFGDLSHFERTFKKLVGCTPGEYRRQQKL